MLKIPTLDDLRAAALRIAPHVHRTPVIGNRTIDLELNATVLFKAENLQKVGAFKARGATNAVFRLPDEVAAAGVITHSSGNHGAALAYAAGRRGIPCTVVMPEEAPPIKIAAVRGYGARVELCPREQRDAVCERYREELGQTLIHPFEHPDVVAGQGTAALELHEQAGGLDLVVAPVGGGGLLSGTTIATEALAPGTPVIAAEPRAADDAWRSMESGRREPARVSPECWSDGLLTQVGELAFEVMRAHGTRVVRVGEAETLAAAWTLMQRAKLLVEPSAATVLAALRELAPEIAGKRVGAILSGGNTDLAWIADERLERS